MHLNRWCFSKWGKPALRSRSRGCTRSSAAGGRRGEKINIYVYIYLLLVLCEAPAGAGSGGARSVEPAPGSDTVCGIPTVNLLGFGCVLVCFFFLITSSCLMREERREKKKKKGCGGSDVGCGVHDITQSPLDGGLISRFYLFFFFFPPCSCRLCSVVELLLLLLLLFWLFFLSPSNLEGKVVFQC